MKSRMRGDRRKGKKLVIIPLASTVRQEMLGGPEWYEDEDRT